MTSDKDYYRILGVLDDAEDIVIRASYRALAQRYHPDKWQGDPVEATRRMAEINEAYAVLSNSEKRSQYNFLKSSAKSDAQHREESNVGEREADNQPGTDSQSGYAAAKGFKEFAGRGSSSSSFKAKQNDNSVNQTNHENRLTEFSMAFARFDSFIGACSGERQWATAPIWKKAIYYLLFIYGVFVVLRWTFNGGIQGLVHWIFDGDGVIFLTFISQFIRIAIRNVIQILGA